MKVTVEIEPGTAAAQTAPAAGAQQQLAPSPPASAAADLADGGAGPGGAGGGTTPAPQAPEMDAAGPPPALIDAIAAAEQASPEGPALPLAGDPGSDALVDGGAGPATL